MSWDIGVTPYQPAPFQWARRYDALLKLIKGDWWLAPTSMTTDAHGQVIFTGFLGDYELRSGSQRIPFALNDKGESSLAIQI